MGSRWGLTAAAAFAAMLPQSGSSFCGFAVRPKVPGGHLTPPHAVCSRGELGVSTQRRPLTVRGSGSGSGGVEISHLTQVPSSHLQLLHGWGIPPVPPLPRLGVLMGTCSGSLPLPVADMTSLFPCPVSVPLAL